MPTTTDDDRTETDDPEPGTYHLTARVTGVTETEARHLWRALGEMLSDAPEVTGWEASLDETAPIDGDRFRDLLAELDREGARPTPRGYAQRLNIRFPSADDAGDGDA